MYVLCDKTAIVCMPLQGRRQVFETGGAKVSACKARRKFLAMPTSGCHMLMHMHLYICRG